MSPFSCHNVVGSDWTEDLIGTGGGTDRWSVIFGEAQGAEEEGRASTEGANLIGRASYALEGSHLGVPA